MKNTGKDYERLVRNIFERALLIEGLGNSTVSHDIKLPGKTRDSNGKPLLHQIDVFWKFESAGMYIK